MQPKKVLLISVSAGAGHVRAAEAIRKTALVDFPDLDVRHIDLLSYVSRPVRHAIIESYGVIVKRFPELWDFLYEKSDAPLVNERLNKLLEPIKRLNLGTFYDAVFEFAPDHIVHTNPYPAHILRTECERRQITTPFSIVVTDFGIHSSWLVPQAAYYFIASNKTAWKIHRRGLPSERIIQSGIPVTQPCCKFPKQNRDQGESKPFSSSPAAREQLS